MVRLSIVFSLVVCSAPAAAQSKQLQYDGFTCDVYGGQATKVLDNDQYNLAYDFNVTELSASSYVAVLHAEPYRKAVGCWGDSVAVRYAGSPDGYFGSRTGDCNDCPGDTVISRTSAFSEMMSSPDCTGLGGLSGGGNPILLLRQGTPAWTLFFLSVSDYDEAAGAHNDWWRHYLMVAHPADVGAMLTSDWAVLANNGSADYWHWFSGQPPKWQDYQPWPARLQSSGALLQSAHEVFQSADTQGLIGSMSYDAALATIHYFYIDIVNGQNVTRRQDMVDLTNVNWWHDPVTIRNDWVNAAFHAGRGLWAVFSNCYDTTALGWDVCLQFTPTSGVGDIGSLPASDQVAHGLGLAAFFNDPVTGGIMEQYGFLKSPYGQIPGDDFRVYVAERSATGAAGGLYDMDMYSVRVDCHCDTAPCGGQCCGAGQVCSGGLCCAPSCAGAECGDDGCGGSCGTCAPGSTCNTQGTCVPDTCAPDCAGRVCGPDPVCGLSCGACGENQACDAAGLCACVALECQGVCCAAPQVCFDAACCTPSCADRVCGDDGCGGSCGQCAAAERCNSFGQCVPDDCVPACGDRSCGPDPDCGLSCGVCDDSATCDATGRCVADPDSAVTSGCDCSAGDRQVGLAWIGLLLALLLAHRRRGDNERQR